ncbi:MAG TPA: DNA-3-methyladenine glycosylase 2 family protein [Actinomycetota bacterium]|jgi:3-methyladenine DNA glycosylase/8-oxoguanine DNA glycosylase|nr:DNA-3-methyladenine glycosylase 2 family protein [Actinomycetota bacterium]
MPSRRVALPRRIDLPKTLGPMQRGRGDPTMRSGRGFVERASRTPDGPVSVRFSESSGGIEVEAWGPGAGWVLDRAAAWCGAEDDDAGFDPPAGLVRDLWRRQPGLWIPRTGLVTERLIPVILEQKVTGGEARRAYRRLVTALAEPAPGPLSLTLPPDPERVAALPYYAFHPFGVERRRAEVVRSVCARTAWIDETAAFELDVAEDRLSSLHGIGPWSVAEVARIALGDADAVSVGDYHVPNIVAWALAREPRGSDERMLELLEPYRPHRGRVQRLLETSGIHAPAYGPKMEPRAIDRI